MSRMLSELLGVNSTLFADDIRRLELTSGEASVDVRLMAEILATSRQKMRELGLDPKDSTGRELYHALLNLVALHDQFIAAKIGVRAEASVEDSLPRIRDAVIASDIHRSAWVMKHSVAKRLLKKCPPKHLMRYLGYKSLDSMLKREPVGELFAGLRLVESEQWYRNFLAAYGQLSPMDFETRKIDVCLLNKKKWQQAASDFCKQQRHNIMHVRELGVILVLPLPFENRRGLVITLLPLLLHQINEIRLYSSFYKLHQMEPSFGERIAASVLNDSGNHVRIANQQVHWRVVHRHFGKPEVAHPEVLEPHVQPDDLAWRKAEETLLRMEPALHFWQHTDYVAVFKNQKPLSFNLMDMALNYFNQFDYDQRVYIHFQDALWNELFGRYVGQPALERQILRQLDYEAVDPEVLRIAQGVA